MRAIGRTHKMFEHAIELLKKGIGVRMLFHSAGYATQAKAVFSALAASEGTEVLNGRWETQLYNPNNDDIAAMISEGWTGAVLVDHYVYQTQMEQKRRAEGQLKDLRRIIAAFKTWLSSIDE